MATAGSRQLDQLRKATYTYTPRWLRPALTTTAGVTQEEQGLNVTRVRAIGFVPSISNVNQGQPLTFQSRELQRDQVWLVRQEALDLYCVIATCDTLGAPTEVDLVTNAAQPFVNRDSVYRFISATLDLGARQLQAAGTASFPFNLTTGFAGFNTPATFRQFNRALAARIQVNRVSLGCGATCYTAALSARNAPGTGLGIPTDVAFSLYPDQATPIPIIRNEELILLRAEANIGLGNLATALTDLNFVRQAAGGLPAIAGLASTDAAIMALLYERRYWLLFEGHRWFDVRRYGQLLSLPLDLPTHFRVSVMPVPQAECVFRQTLATTLLGSGCP